MKRQMKWINERRMISNNEDDNDINDNDEE